MADALAARGQIGAAQLPVSEHPLFSFSRKLLQLKIVQKYRYLVFGSVHPLRKCPPHFCLKEERSLCKLT
jgi:hypothetical protein